MQGILTKIALWALACSFLWPMVPTSTRSLRPTDITAGDSQKIFIPLIVSAAQPAVHPRVNLPIFPVSGSADPYFNQAAIFWFGQVSPTTSYTDVRIAGTQTELAVYASVIDSLLWYSPQPVSTNLTQWDSATFYLRLAGDPAAAPDAKTYRFDSQFSWYESRTGYQAAFKGKWYDLGPGAGQFHHNGGLSRSRWAQYWTGRTRLGHIFSHSLCQPGTVRSTASGYLVANWNRRPQPEQPGRPADGRRILASGNDSSPTGELGTAFLRHPRLSVAQ